MFNQVLDRWQLPDGIEEVLPAQAQQVEGLRRHLLDLYASWGYELVIPPLMEFVDSLLIGLDGDLDLLTFRMTDQMSGRTLGVRADITPQVARIDAHSFAQEGVTRLCYAGSLLHTRPRSLMASRSPIQVGAELYGDETDHADLEVIDLMLATLELAGFDRLTLNLGHVGVFTALRETISLPKAQEAKILDAMARKSVPDLEEAVAGLPADVAALICQLVTLHGSADVLEKARDLFAKELPAASHAIDKLSDIAKVLLSERPELDIYYDLAELRGYHYHTGMVFAAYSAGHGQALANGGRYDAVGEVFGRARPATGFATDLKVLMMHTNAASAQTHRSAIAMPAADDAALREVVKALREGGETVINQLSGVPDARCDRELINENGQWVVKPLANGSNG